MPPKSESFLKKVFKSIGFFLWMWVVVITFLFICSYFLSSVEPGNEICDICAGDSQKSVNLVVPQSFSLPGFEYEPEEERNDDPFFDNPELIFEHSETGWNLTDALFFSFGVISSSGSSFLPTTNMGFFIAYILVFIGVPLLLILISLIGNYMKALISFIDKRIRWTTPTFKPEETVQKRYFCQEQCCADRPCSSSPPRDRWIDFDPYEAQLRSRTCPKRENRVCLLPGAPPSIPVIEKEEEKPKNDEESPFLELPIAFVISIIFWLTTTALIRNEQEWTLRDSFLMSALFFTTAGSLEFRTSSIIRNVLLMCWGIVGISVFSVLFQIISGRIEKALRLMFHSLECIFAEEETRYNVDNDIRPNYQCLKPTPRIIYYDPYNYRERY